LCKNRESVGRSVIAWLVSSLCSSAPKLPKCNRQTSPQGQVRAIGLRLCFIDGQRSSAQIGPVERRNCFIGFSSVGHFDKTETTGLAGFPVRH